MHSHKNESNGSRAIVSDKFLVILTVRKINLTFPGETYLIFQNRLNHSVIVVFSAILYIYIYKTELEIFANIQQKWKKSKCFF